MKTASLLSCILFLTTLSFASFEKDSVFFAHLIDKSLHSQDSAKLFLSQASNWYEKNKKSNEFKWKETYNYQFARYYLLTGELNEAKIVLDSAIRNK